MVNWMLTLLVLMLMSLGRGGAGVTSAGRGKLVTSMGRERAGVTSEGRYKMRMSLGQDEARLAAEELPLDISTVEDGENALMQLNIRVNKSGVTLHLPSQSVYEQVGEGVHVVVLHAHTGHVVARRVFVTHQPGEDHRLAQFLSHVQEGRVLVLAGVPQFNVYLKHAGVDALVMLGSVLVTRAAHGEPWALVAVTGGEGKAAGVLGEALATAEMGVPGQVRAPSLHLRVHYGLQHSHTGGWCGWEPVKMTPPPGVTSSQEQFCERYDGYGDLCDCDQPFIPTSHTYTPASFPMREMIPMVIVTANKPFHLYRLLKNLWWVEGAEGTEVLVVVDGPHRETLDLLALFPKVEVVVHRPQGPPGHNTRTNSNVAFALYSVFSRWPRADKAIVLEDDLVLAPDILRYFHHLAPALTFDPSLYMVSAWGQHSYPSTADDPAAVHRVEAYPQYGWMTTRAWALRALPLWAPNGIKVDWDWWVYGEGVRRGMEGLVPEISRTAHLGAAGAHVTAWEQHLFFSHRLTTISRPVPPYSALTPVERLLGDQYSRWMDEQIRTATKIHLHDHPCYFHPVPANTSGAVVLYLGVASRSDEHNSFYLMQACLGTDDQEVRELYHGVMTLRVRPYNHARTAAARAALHQYSHTLMRIHNHRGTAREEEEREEGEEEGKREEESSRVLYIVGCPLSEYCRHSAGPSDWIIPDQVLMREVMQVTTKRRMMGTKAVHRVRVAARSPEEEFHLANVRRLEAKARS